VLQGKPQINFGAWFTESILSFQHSLNIKILKKNHLETQTNAQNNKRQNLSIKIAAAWRIFSPHLNMSGILADFCEYRGLKFTNSLNFSYP
jgi:hypothetical protein